MDCWIRRVLVGLFQMMRKVEYVTLLRLQLRLQILSIDCSEMPSSGLSVMLENISEYRYEMKMYNVRDTFV